MALALRSLVVRMQCSLLALLLIDVDCIWAEELRFTGWHDKLADRKKFLYEKDTQMLTVQTTRELAMRAIVRHMRGRSGAEPRTRGTDLYEFGVYTGGGLRMWLRMMQNEGLEFAGSIWGFDSFEGMPSEDLKFKSKLRQRDKGWLEGGLNAAEQMGVSDWTMLCRTLIKNIGYAHAERAHLIRGFYNESLASGRRLARRWRMKPALLVDLDCDLYTSSAQALRFVLDAGVLLPGSYVYLDDIMPWVWRQTKAAALEQKLAFEELTHEYQLLWDEVPLNATRRDYVNQRPVLMLSACGRCRRHESLSGAGPGGHANVLGDSSSSGSSSGSGSSMCIDGRAAVQHDRGALQWCTASWCTAVH